MSKMDREVMKLALLMCFHCNRLHSSERKLQKHQAKTLHRNIFQRKKHSDSVGEQDVARADMQGTSHLDVQEEIPAHLESSGDGSQVSGQSDEELKSMTDKAQDQMEELEEAVASDKKLSESLELPSNTLDKSSHDNTSQDWTDVDITVMSVDAVPGVNKTSSIRYWCTECDQTFSMQSLLNIHKSFHNVTLPQHLCLICGKSFDNQKYLDQHTLKFHAGWFKVPDKKLKLSKNIFFKTLPNKKQKLISKYFVKKIGGKKVKLTNTVLPTKEIPPDQNKDLVRNTPNKEIPVENPDSIQNIPIREENVLNQNIIKNIPITEENDPNQNIVTNTPIRIIPDQKLIRTASITEKPDANNLFNKNTHIIENKFKCNICKQCFKTVMSLRKHILTCPSDKIHKECVDESKIRKFSCEICDKSFKVERNVQNHINCIHIQHNNYTCSVCKKKCVSLAYLKRHMNSVHTKLRQHPCQFCNKKYAGRASLFYHLKSEHNFEPKTYKETENIINITDNNNKTIESFTNLCHICGENFKLLNELEIHISQHLQLDTTSDDDNDRKKIKCQFCEESYNDESILFAHVLKVHDSQRNHYQGSLNCLKCSICEQHFTCINSLRLHEESMHCSNSLLCLICHQEIKGGTQLMRESIIGLNQLTASLLCKLCQLLI